MRKDDSKAWKCAIWWSTWVVNVALRTQSVCIARRDHMNAVSVFPETQARKSSTMNMISFHELWLLWLPPGMMSHTVIANFVSASQISPPHHVVLSEKQTRWDGILHFHKWPLRYDFMGHQFYIPLKILYRWTGIFLQISVLILFLFQLLLNKLTKKKVGKEIKCRAKSDTINRWFAECHMSKAFG